MALLNGVNYSDVASVKCRSATLNLCVMTRIQACQGGRAAKSGLTALRSGVRKNHPLTTVSGKTVTVPAGKLFFSNNYLINVSFEGATIDGETGTSADNIVLNSYMNTCIGFYHTTKRSNLFKLNGGKKYEIYLRCIRQSSQEHRPH